MKLSHLYLGLIIALAVLNMIVFAIHCHRCGAGQARKVKSARKLFRRLSKKLFIRPSGAYLVVVKDCSMRLGDRSTYTAMEGARVVSAGARGLAMAGSHILAQDRAETIALEGSNTVGEAGSVTHAYTGAIVRAKRAAAVKLGRGVKAYARDGCQVFDDGGNIYNTGDPSVLEGFEPALVVGEADSFIYAGEGSVVIAEPQVVVKSVSWRTTGSITR